MFHRMGIPILLLVLLSVILCFILSVLEKDFYPGGSSSPIAPSCDEWPRILERRITHLCRSSECVHELRAMHNRRIFQLRDHDGWYKLFWAGDDTIYFVDPLRFAEATRFRDAHDPQGKWALELEVQDRESCHIEGTLRIRYLLTVESRDRSIPSTSWIGFTFDAPDGQEMKRFSFVWILRDPMDTSALLCSCPSP